MNSDQQKRIGIATLIVLGVVFIVAVMASNTLLRGMRLDLTENRLYTLSEGTLSLLRNLDEPINLYYFFSDRETGEVQFLRDYATRVREMLEEFADRADGNIVLNVVDPLPFSEEEDRAAQFGLQPVSLGNLGDSIYFGLAGTNSVGDEEIIAFFQSSKENFLEYDLARLVYALANRQKAV
ncbi:MAG TPA: GldG family protein, partial [Gammaproteobacteria bacterium]|nr:GldG family protein [Gammaproteobacteria bacterium]